MTKVDAAGDRYEPIDADSALTAAALRQAPTRSLIAALAATEDGLRHEDASADRRRDLIASQARIVRELRRRRTQWRRP